MTPIAPTTRSPRLLLALGTLLALVVALLLASPAAAQFVDEGSGDEAAEAPADDAASEDAGDDTGDDTGEASSASEGNGFVGEQEPAPVGGVDAGFGGGVGADGGLGAPHATAAGLLGLALAGHVINARRPVRG